MDADFMIDLAARCQRVAILAELIRIRCLRTATMREAALKGKARQSLALPRNDFPSTAAGGGFKSSAPEAHNILPTVSNPAAGGRVGMAGLVEELMARQRVSAEEHNRFSWGRW